MLMGLVLMGLVLMFGRRARDRQDYRDDASVFKSKLHRYAFAFSKRRSDAGEHQVRPARRQRYAPMRRNGDRLKRQRRGAAQVKAAAA